MLVRGLQVFEAELKKNLGNSGERLATDQRITYLNTLKILVFLTIEFANFLEKKHLTAKDADLMPTNARVRSQIGLF
jgi:hypothetical protein